jgi:flagellar assembly factor FliW
LALASTQEAHVLAILGKCDLGLTLNLKAPVVLNMALRLGRQVVANGDAPLQYELSPEPAPLKMSA